jgi:hypothetical protein
MFLTKEKYEDIAKSIGGGHWKTYVKRWDCHNKAIEIVKAKGILSNKKVLEIGTMGVQIVNGSDTLDYFKAWNFPGKNPNYAHDMRKIPWPIPGETYEWSIAMRVFHHLGKFKKLAFQEMKRISEKIIIVCPDNVSKQNFIGLAGRKPPHSAGMLDL